ncbi:unnamed protein product [Paramecium sonneborni]|uniref:MORN repeat protein n=1 Tax=Paramecium sonneborni TaxID=65129 RepID=A0A8S1RPQ5_9CILI|nr:unnamed protein product [Paramecium sonneborni]
MNSSNNPEMFNNVDQIGNLQLAWQKKQKRWQMDCFLEKQTFREQKGKSKDYGKIYSSIFLSKLLILNNTNTNHTFFKLENILLTKELENGILNIKIGGGYYNHDNCKQGKWIELDEGFYFKKQVTYNGEYNMKGMKIGKWNSMYCESHGQEYKQIGGGSYDQDGNQKKMNQMKGFISINKSLTMVNIICKRWKQQYCGGGSYDQDGNQKKIGKWVELDKKFSKVKQVTYNGEYNKQGMKIGMWDSMYCCSFLNTNKQIGGGLYDQDGNQKKIGKWVELDERFDQWNQVTHNCEYNMQGIKISN